MKFLLCSYCNLLSIYYTLYKYVYIVWDQCRQFCHIVNCLFQVHSFVKYVDFDAIGRINILNFDTIHNIFYCLNIINKRFLVHLSLSSIIFWSGTIIPSGSLDRNFTHHQQCLIPTKHIHYTKVKSDLTYTEIEQDWWKNCH